jgi:hypothetical protein
MKLQNLLRVIVDIAESPQLRDVIKNKTKTKTLNLIEDVLEALEGNIPDMTGLGTSDLSYIDLIGTPAV